MCNSDVRYPIRVNFPPSAGPCSWDGAAKYIIETIRPAKRLLKRCFTRRRDAPLSRAHDFGQNLPGTSNTFFIGPVPRAVARTVHTRRSLRVRTNSARRSVPSGQRRTLSVEYSARPGNEAPDHGTDSVCGECDDLRARRSFFSPRTYANSRVFFSKISCPRSLPLIPPETIALREETAEHPRSPSNEFQSLVA